MTLIKLHHNYMVRNRLKGRDNELPLAFLNNLAISPRYFPPSSSSDVGVLV
jgi:hypothetical protein